MKNISIKKIVALSVISLFFVQAFYLVAVEPTISSAASVTDTIVVTLNVTSGVTISTGADTTMTPNIGIASDRAIGSSSWSVATNSATGYTLAVKASTTPALKNGVVDNFADYTEATPGTPDVWGGVASGAKEFGYSAYGTDVPTATWGTASTCGDTLTGVPNVLGKYRGFTTADITIASRAGVTPTTGVTSNICFAAQQNAVYAASGSYTATITATATAS
jgi:hypothetical protein